MLLAPHVEVADFDALLDAAAGKTSLEIEELLARRGCGAGLRPPCRVGRGDAKGPVVSVAEHHAHAPRSVRCFVLTVSDSRTDETDDAGRLCRERLSAAGHEVAGARIVRDEPHEVAALVRRVAADRAADAILLNGGTGIAPRDSTFEAVSALFDRRIDGFGELFRALSFAEIGPAAMLSRAAAGVVGGVAVFSMPGSPDAVRLAMDRLIVPELAHVVGELRR